MSKFYYPFFFFFFSSFPSLLSLLSSFSLSLLFLLYSLSFSLSFSPPSSTFFSLHVDGSQISPANKRKRPSNSDFMNLSDAVSRFAGLAPVGPTTPQPVPQGLVPIRVVAKAGMMVPTNVFWMIPPNGSGQVVFAVGPSSQQPQIWTLPPTMMPVFNIVAARPISTYVAMRRVEVRARSPTLSNSVVSTNTMGR